MVPVQTVMESGNTIDVMNLMEPVGSVTLTVSTSALGSVPEGISVQVPTEPTKSQALQVLLQAVLQQTPSRQCNPEEQT